MVSPSFPASSEGTPHALASTYTGDKETKVEIEEKIQNSA